MGKKMYQISTLSALALGYTRPVTTVEELLTHGDTGLGTFEGVDGEMIVLDGVCYRALDDGSVVMAEKDKGVPFASVAYLGEPSDGTVREIQANSIDEVKTKLDLKIEEGFGLNSMHIVRIDADFKQVKARSESGYNAHHVSLKEMLDTRQKDFAFENVKGTLVCVYYPDYMDGINAPGWHLHFVSDDKTMGGHVFEVEGVNGTARFARLTSIEIQVPSEPAFDTYSLKSASQDEIKKVEQGKG